MSYKTPDFFSEWLLEVSFNETNIRQQADEDKLQVKENLFMDFVRWIQAKLKEKTSAEAQIKILKHALKVILGLQTWFTLLK